MKVVGRIVIVQEDRIRLVDGDGRGYLFVVHKRSVSPETLEHWRDAGERVEVEYSGRPDRGAVALSLRTARSRP